MSKIVKIHIVKMMSTLMRKKKSSTDTETVKDYLDTITSLKLKDYVTYNAN